jgi:hypothetical protein
VEFGGMHAAAASAQFHGKLPVLALFDSPADALRSCSLANGQL